MRTVVSARPVQAFAALCILACTVCTPAYAQSDNAPDIEDRWVLQFGVANNFNLSSFQGTLLSVKKQYDARRAFRAGLNLGANIERNATEEGAGTEEQNANDQFISANAQWLRYPVRDRNLRAYWGLGPTIGFNRSVSETERDGSVMRERDVLFLRGGVRGVLGAEWFVRSRISLSAEYRTDLTYEWRRNEQENAESTRQAFSIGSRSVLFGVSVYF